MNQMTRGQPPSNPSGQASSGPHTQSGIAIEPAPAFRKPRADGIRSRETILLAAARLATVKGLDSLSLGDLAKHLGISKSGLFAHFGSKQALELATIETAERIFTADVITPVLAAPPGLARLTTLVDRMLEHVAAKTFPGGCFFSAVAAELAARPGPSRDRICLFVDHWLKLINQCLTEARDAGELDKRADLSQLNFEIHAMIGAANTSFVMSGDAAVLGRARTGIAHIIARATTPKYALSGRADLK